MSESLSPASSIRAVLFDYGMVLSGPPEPQAWERLRAIFDVEEAAFYPVYWRYRDDYDRGKLNAAAYWPVVAKDLGKPLSEEQYNSVLAIDVDVWAQVNRDMMEWAAALHQAGFKTGILSNIGDAMEIGLRARYGWIEDFDHHTFSHRLGIAKPDAAIYRHAAEGLGVPPEQILFVDDREENIAAAIQAGLQGIQYTGHDAFVAAMRAREFGELLEPTTLSS